MNEQEVQFLPEVATDREDAIKDYMELCGYTRKEAITAYNNVKRFEDEQ